jgi:hypothetical protein
MDAEGAVMKLRATWPVVVLGATWGAIAGYVAAPTTIQVNIRQLLPIDLTHDYSGMPLIPIPDGVIILQPKDYPPSILRGNP